VAQSFAPSMNEAGQMTGIVPSWLVTLTLRNVLLGQADFTRMSSLTGMIPPDEAFDQAVSALFELVCQERDKAMRVPVAAQ
jgi:hypothetical protein